MKEPSSKFQSTPPSRSMQGSREATCGGAGLGFSALALRPGVATRGGAPVVGEGGELRLGEGWRFVHAEPILLQAFAHFREVLKLYKLNQEGISAKLVGASDLMDVLRGERVKSEGSL